MGRPLVANRTSWVVSRRPHACCDKMTTDEQRDRCSRRLAAAVDVPARHDRGTHAGLCGEAGPRAGHLLERLAVPAGAGRRRTSAQQVALRDPRAARGLPGGARRAAERARLPAPVRHQPRPRARLPQPDHRGRARRRPRPTTTRSVNGASVGRPGRRGEAVRQVAARACPATSGSPSTRWAACSATTARSRATPGDTLVTSIDARVQGVVEQQLAQTDQDRPRRPSTRSPHRNYVADSGAVVVMEAKTGRVVAMASQPTYDPEVWVGGITTKQLARLYSDKAGTPLLVRATQGQFAPGSTWKPIMTAGALNNGFTPEHPARLLLGLPGRQPAGSRTTSPASYGDRSASTRRCRSPATRSSTASATTSGSSTAPTRPT